MVVPGLQSTVSMHGRVIGPIVMLEMQGTCCARDGSWEINPRARRRQGSPVPDPPVHQKSVRNMA